MWRSVFIENNLSTGFTADPRAESPSWFSARNMQALGLVHFCSLLFSGSVTELLPMFWTPEPLLRTEQLLLCYNTVEEKQYLESLVYVLRNWVTEGKCLKKKSVCVCVCVRVCACVCVCVWEREREGGGGLFLNLGWHPAEGNLCFDPLSLFKTYEDSRKLNGWDCTHSMK